MIQILGLRNLKDSDKKYDAFHEKNWRYPSVSHLFLHLESVLKQIPGDEQWNLFYTVANCGEGKREFKSQNVIAFDVDGIDVEKLEDYINIVLETLGIYRQDTGIVASGNGLHFLVGLDSPITEKEYFAKHRPQYRALLNKINLALATRGLKGNADPAVWDARRILRVPGTANRKPNRPERMATLIQGHVNPVSFNLEAKSGLKIVKPEEQVPEQLIKKYRFDTAAILSECEFIKWCKEKPGEISEPQWYAALSIVGYLENGKQIAHDLSKGHKGYSAVETDDKLSQAMSASKPRTCKNIESLSSKCQGCKHFGKVTSPMGIRGEGFIQTELSGFHTLIYKDGDVEKKIPCYDDLIKFFEQKTQYKIFDSSRIVYVHNGKHYEEISKSEIEAFAQEHFDPSCSNKMADEFRGRVMRNHIKKAAWWKDSTDGLMNFQNGVLNLSTQEFLPHSKEYGFRFVLPFAYEAKAKAPIFEKMLGLITSGKIDVAQVILEYMGYCMVADNCWAQKALMLVGDGANGKSTLINIFKKMVGRGNYAAVGLRDLHMSEYSRQMLDGKLLNISEETPSKSLLDSSMFKNLVTGNDVQMRAPYKEPYTNAILAKQIFTCNEIPETTDTSHGFFRRLLLIEFHHKFSKEDASYDPHIEQKLECELSGIFNIAFAAYLGLKERKAFVHVKDIERAVAELKETTDTVQKWLKHWVIFYPINSGKGKSIPIGDLYENCYRPQTEGSRERVKNKDQFAKRLKKIIKDYDTRYLSNTSVGEKKCRALSAIDICEDADLNECNIFEQVLG